MKKKKKIDDEDEFDEEEAWADVKKAKEEVLGKPKMPVYEATSATENNEPNKKKHQP